ncbi:MAG: hypothetical protein ABSF44_15545 [Candidatus Bathyarchaeia archaeon]
MRETFRINSFLWFAAVVSIFGLATVTVLLMKPTGYDGGNFAFTPTIIGLLYTATCVFGVFAVFFPQKCQRTLIFGKYVQSPGDQTFAPGKLQFTGHHPDCSRFSANRIKIRNKVLCSACSGLLIGAMIAIAGAVSYFFFRFDFLWSDLRILVVSDAGLFLGLFQFRFAGWIKLSVNALFVVCSLVTLVEADLLSKSLFIDLYVLGLIVFMLSARILLSEWNNKRTCNKCLRCV